MPSLRAVLVAGGAGLLAALVQPPAAAAEGTPMARTSSDLAKFNVTVRRFDPARGFASGTDFILPVDSPDKEHAASAAMSNAVAFTRKLDGDRVLPVAFACIAVTRR